MRCKHLLFVAASLAALSVVSCKPKEGSLSSTGTGEKVALQINLKKGDKLTYLSTATMDQQIMGKSIAVKITTTTDLDVTGLTDKSFNTVTTTKDVKVECPSMPAVEGMAKSMIGTKIEGEYDFYGNKVVSKTNSSNATAQQLGSAVDATNVGFMGLVCPKEKVGAGTNWETKVDFGEAFKKAASQMKFKGGTSIPFKFTLTKFVDEGGKKLALLDISANGTIEGEMSGAQTQTMKMEISMKGTAKLEVARGILVDVSQDMTISTSAQGQSFVQKINTKTTLK